MKIIQINAIYGSLSTGTIVKDIHELCISSGIESFIISPNITCDLDNKNIYRVGNIVDEKTHALLSRLTGKQAYYSTFSTLRLIKTIKGLKPDIVHLHNLHNNFINLPLLMKFLNSYNIKTFISLHDCWFYTGGCTHYTRLKCNRWLDSCGNCKDGHIKVFDSSRSVIEDRKIFFQSRSNIVVIGVSDWIRNQAIQNVFRGCTNYTVYNGVDMSVFHYSSSNLREVLGLEGKYIILGPASKWLDPIRKQNLLDFVSCLHDNEVLLLFGCKHTLINVPKGVYLYGFTQSREELAKLYSMADVFANCSYEESFSLISVECQACGTPAVVFNNTGMSETVDGETGFRVETGDYLGLLDACRKLSSLENKEQQEKRLRFIRKNFDKNNNYLRLIEIYRTI